MTLSKPPSVTPPPPAPSTAETAEGPPEVPRRLMNRNFFLLWQGRLVSRLGDQAFLIAMMFWTKEATGSSSLMGVLLMVSTLPAVLLSPMGGTFADRHSRYAIIVGGDILRGVAAIALAVWMLTAPEQTSWLLVGLVVVTANLGVVDSLFVPAVHATVPEIVPRNKIAAANALQRLSSQGSVFLGQALGGVLYRLLGAPLLFLFDGVSYLLSALSESFLRIPQELPEKEASSRGLKGTLSSYLQDTREGLSWIWRDTGMRTFLVTAAALNFFLSPLHVLLPFYVTDFLHQGAEWYGFLLAAEGAGSVAGYILAASFRLEGSTRVQLTVVSLMGSGLAMAAIGSIHVGWLALALFFGFGFLVGIVNILVFTLFQLATPAKMRGRVIGLVMAATSAALPLGMGLSGLLGDLTDQNLPWIFGVSGAIIVAVTVWATSRPAFRRFLRLEQDSDPA